MFDSPPHVYPYKGRGNAHDHYANYTADMYEDYEHGVKLEYPYASIDRPADFVQLLVWQTDTDYPGDGYNFGGITLSESFGTIVNMMHEEHINDFNWKELRNANPHEIGHALGCGHCDAVEGEYAPEPDAYSPAWDVMAAPDSNPMCSHTPSPGYRTLRFSSECAEHLESALNSRAAPTGAGGPQFGF